MTKQRKSKRKPLCAGPAKGYPPQGIMRAEVLRLISHRLSTWTLDDLVVIGMVTGLPDADRAVVLASLHALGESIHGPLRETAHPVK
jgi:hypothetical protein